MSCSRSYAVGIVIGTSIVSIVERRVSLQEAAGFVRSYNSIDDERQAVIITHPISRAILLASSKSRAS